MNIEIYKTDKGKLILVFNGGVSQVTVRMPVVQAMAFLEDLKKKLDPSKVYNIDEDGSDDPDGVTTEARGNGLLIHSVSPEISASFKIPAQSLLGVFENIRKASSKILGQVKNLWDDEQNAALMPAKKQEGEEEFPKSEQPTLPERKGPALPQRSSGHTKKASVSATKGAKKKSAASRSR